MGDIAGIYATVSVDTVAAVANLRAFDNQVHASAAGLSEIAAAADAAAASTAAASRGLAPTAAAGVGQLATQYTALQGAMTGVSETAAAVDASIANGGVSAIEAATSTESLAASYAIVAAAAIPAEHEIGKVQSNAISAGAAMTEASVAGASLVSSEVAVGSAAIGAAAGAQTLAAGVHGVATAQSEAAVTAREVAAENSNLAGGFGRATAVAVGLGAAVTAVQGVLSSAAQAAIQEELAVSRLSQSLKNVGIDYEDVSDQVSAAVSKNKGLGFGGTEQLTSLDRLVLVTHDVTKAQEAQAVAMDLARGKGLELSTATLLVSRVLSGNTAILRRYGIDIQAGASATEAMAKLQAQFAGQAENYGNQQAGVASRIKIAIGDTVQAVGGLLGPFQGVISLLPQFTLLYATWGGAVGGLTRQLATTLPAALSASTAASTRLTAATTELAAAHGGDVAAANAASVAEGKFATTATVSAAEVEAAAAGMGGAAAEMGGAFGVATTEAEAAATGMGGAAALMQEDMAATAAAAAAAATEVEAAGARAATGWLAMLGPIALVVGGVALVIAIVKKLGEAFDIPGLRQFSESMDYLGQIVDKVGWTGLISNLFATKKAVEDDASAVNRLAREALAAKLPVDDLIAALEKANPGASPFDQISKSIEGLLTQVPQLAQEFAGLSRVINGTAGFSPDTLIAKSIADLEDGVNAILTAPVTKIQGQIDALENAQRSVSDALTRQSEDEAAYINRRLAILQRATATVDQLNKDLGPGFDQKRRAAAAEVQKQKAAEELATLDKDHAKTAASDARAIGDAQKALSRLLDGAATANAELTILQKKLGDAQTALKNGMDAMKKFFDHALQVELDKEHAAETAKAGAKAILRDNAPTIGMDNGTPAIPPPSNPWAVSPPVGTLSKANLGGTDFGALFSGLGTWLKDHLPTFPDRPQPTVPTGPGVHGAEERGALPTLPMGAMGIGGLSGLFDDIEGWLKANPTPTAPPLPVTGPGAHGASERAETTFQALPPLPAEGVPIDLSNLTKTFDSFIATLQTTKNEGVIKVEHTVAISDPDGILKGHEEEFITWLDLAGVLRDTKGQMRGDVVNVRGPS